MKLHTYIFAHVKDTLNSVAWYIIVKLSMTELSIIFSLAFLMFSMTQRQLH